MKRATSVELYDYGARMYYLQIGRTIITDPHAEFHFAESPYSFLGNNPILNIDPDGMDWYPNWFTEKQVWFDGSDKHFLYSHNEGGYYSSLTATVTDYSSASVYQQPETSNKLNIYKIPASTSLMISSIRASSP